MSLLVVALLGSTLISLCVGLYNLVVRRCFREGRRAEKRRRW
jgi:hypothetical protein